MPEVSKIHSHIAGRDVRPLMITAGDVKDALVGNLPMLGITGISKGKIAAMMAALDAAPDLAPLVGTAALGAPLQFLQAWLPGLVHILTAARKIDELIGVTTIGSFEDEEFIQGVLEPTGLPQPYGDHAQVPLASWNLNYERRSIVRFEQGMEVGYLEDLRTSRQRVNTAAQKRNSASLSLDILRNRVGFYGYNAGAGRTYGFLNDPNEPAYVNVANGIAGTPGWATKTWREVIQDIREAAGALQAATQDNVNPRTTPTTLAIPTGSDTYMSLSTDFGISVEEWTRKTYPAMRVVSVPELAGANGGVNVFYLYADKVVDGVSDDGGDTWLQAVPSKFQMLGSEKKVKAYLEDYANALGGVMLKRPMALIRRSGI